MLSFLLDEHLRGRIYEILQRFNEASGWPLDVTVIGEHDLLPLGTPDPAILDWAEAENRIFITGDKHISTHLRRHFEAGKHLPGVIILIEQPSEADVRPIFDYLVLANGASEIAEWRDQTQFFPH